MWKNLANTYFQFKQFQINQDKCAMKVCTDACIQGALAAQEVQRRKPVSVLDIGCGTGILSLMLAQNYSFNYQDAIEINQEAAEQAAGNFKISTFDHQIRLFQSDVRKFVFNRQYDFIICNPPFYENALKSPSEAGNQAMHGSHLCYAELLTAIERLLNSDGRFCVMLPFRFEQEWIEKSKDKGFFPVTIFNIRHNPMKQPFRTVFFFSRDEQTLSRHELIIRNNDNTYTTEFKALLQPYYLHL